MAGIKPIGYKPYGLQYTVMIIDDSKTARAVLKQMLLSMQFKIIEEAEHGEIAIHKIKTQRLRPDFIFIDMEMPMMNGVDTIRLIKPLVPDAKIVMVTAHSNKDLVMELINLGGCGFIKKPYDRDTIVKKLTSIIRGSCE